MNIKHTFLILPLACLLTGIVWMSVRVTAAEEAATPSKGTLKHLFLNINGEKTKIDAHSSIEIVKGDLVTLLEGWCEVNGVAQKADQLDLLGFAPKRNRGVLKDDTTFVIDTAKDLQEQFSIDPAKSSYEVRAIIAGQPLGSVVIKLVPPRLDRVEVSINGHSKFLHDGDTLKLRSTDKIAVRQVVTNVRGNENIRHELKTNSAKSKISPSKELVFARGNQIIGRIPIQWLE